MLESRGHVRYDIVGIANIKPEDGTSHAIKTELIDICYNGIGVRSGKNMEVGLAVSLELILKQFDKPITGTGKIKGSKEIKGSGDTLFRLGIEFTDIDKEAIRFVISQIHGTTYGPPRNKPPKTHRG